MSFCLHVAIVCCHCFELVLSLVYLWLFVCTSERLIKCQVPVLQALHVSISLFWGTLLQHKKVKWYYKTVYIFVQVISIACLHITTTRQTSVSPHVFILEISATYVYFVCKSKLEHVYCKLVSDLCWTVKDSLIFDRVKHFNTVCILFVYILMSFQNWGCCVVLVCMNPS